MPPPKKARQMPRCTKEWGSIRRSGTQILVFSLADGLGDVLRRPLLSCDFCATAAPSERTHQDKGFGLRKKGRELVNQLRWKFQRVATTGTKEKPYEPRASFIAAGNLSSESSCCDFVHVFSFKQSLTEMFAPSR
eukprot:5251491-Amphidinium_carterae.1